MNHIKTAQSFRLKVVLSFDFLNYCQFEYLSTPCTTYLEKGHNPKYMKLTIFH